MNRPTLAILFAAIVAAAVVAATAGRGGVSLHQIDGSGVKGTVSLRDTAAGIVVSGTARGLDPALNYRSLFYDKKAKPSGPDACLPTGAGPTTLIGFWIVAADGTGALDIVVPGFKIADFGTMSIRTGPTLAACGKLTRRTVP